MTTNMNDNTSMTYIDISIYSHIYHAMYESSSATHLSTGRCSLAIRLGELVVYFGGCSSV